MERRSFVRLCSLAAAAHVQMRLSGVADAAAQTKQFNRVQLVDSSGKPLQASTLQTSQAYVFQYPYQSTPVFLIRLSRRAAQGAGSDGSVVAFSAICAHQLSYPSKDFSAIGYSAGHSEVAGRSEVIVCCAHHSVYDPAENAKVIGGPAPYGLAVITLEHDAATDALYAVGVSGNDRFDDFFRAYKEDLIDRYGPGKTHLPATDTAVAIPLNEFSHMSLHC